MSDKMDGSVTYKIEQIGKYDGVSVAKEENNPEKGFIKCTHTPMNGKTSTKASVKYNNDELKDKDKSPIKDAKEQNISMIIVYHGENITNEKLVKSKEGNPNCVPLLVELKKKGDDGPEYYVHEYDPESKGSKWVKLNDWLKDVLPQLGLGTNYKQYGFNKLRALLEDLGVLKDYKKDLTTTINAIKGDQLKKLLEQKIGDSEDNKPLLNLVISRIKFGLSESVIIFLEKKPNERYKYSKMKKLINHKDESTIMNKDTIVSLGHKKADHEKDKKGKDHSKESEEEDEEEEEDEDDEDDEDDEEDDDLYDMPFKYYTHTVEIKNGTGNDTATSDQIEVCPFISNIKIETYDKAGSVLEGLYFEKGVKEVKVFFYEDDPRPLLVMCGKKAYRPKNLSCYYTKWVRVEFKEVEGVIDRKNIEVMDTLCEIAYCLNPVYLERNSHKYHTGAKYIVHEFHTNKRSTNIEVDIFEEDMNCYKEYTHQAGTPDHALGEISHNGIKLFNSYEDYKKTVVPERAHRFPDNVTVYYYMYDKHHSYPLMIELHYVYYFDDDGYKEGTDDFYKLVEVSNGKCVRWVKIGDDSSKGGEKQSDKFFLDEVKRLTRENREYIKGLNDYEEPDYPDESPKYTELRNFIQTKLKEIRENLGISYEKKRKNLILETANNCREDTNVSAIVGAVLPISLLGIVGGVAYFKYSSNITHFYRKLF